MAVRIAGKYGDLLRHPATIGAIAAGASLAGNALGLDDQDKGTGRVLLEALGTGLGAAGLSHAVRPAMKAEPLARALTGGPTALAVGLGAPIGNLIGGGIANIANLIGVPGMSKGPQRATLNQQAYYDPYRWGAANSMNVYDPEAAVY